MSFESRNSRVMSSNATEMIARFRFPFLLQASGDSEDRNNHECLNRVDFNCLLSPTNRGQGDPMSAENDWKIRLKKRSRTKTKLKGLGEV